MLITRTFGAERAERVSHFRNFSATILATRCASRNVLTVQAGLTFDPATDWTVGLIGLWATTDEDVLAGGDEDIGFEIDLFAEYRYSAETTFSAGVGFFFADDSAPTVGGGFAAGDDDVAVLFYLQSRVVF